MPRRDGTGPDGQGAKTGRGLGNCTTDANGITRRNRRPRDGRGQGFGRGNRGR